MVRPAASSDWTSKRCIIRVVFFFFFSSRRRHTRSLCDWSSDVCSSDLVVPSYTGIERLHAAGDQVQYGGRVLYRDGQFKTADGMGHFMALTPPELSLDRKSVV